MNKKTNFDYFLKKTNLKYTRFHRATYKKTFVRSETIKIHKQSLKEYIRFDKIILPDPNLPKSITLKNVLLNRRSSTAFGGDSLSLQDISTLLYYSAGLNNQSLSKDNRFYHSTGFSFPLEVYLLSLDSELGNFIYHYQVNTHSLEILWEIDKSKTLTLFDKHWEGNPAFFIVFGAQFSRTTDISGDRGYRFVLSEIGSLSQNFYLISSALQINCTTTEYLDTKLNQLLGLNGLDETVVQALVFGSKPKNAKL